MSVRDRVGGRLRRRIDAAIRWRATEAADAAVAERVRPVARRAQDIHDWVVRVEAKANWAENQLRRIAPQLAAIEARLADFDDLLRERVTTAPEVSDGERAMLDLITAEHERVRARLSAVALYEERLRRLEERPATPDA